MPFFSYQCSNLNLSPHHMGRCSWPALVDDLRKATAFRMVEWFCWVPVIAFEKALKKQWPSPSIATTECGLMQSISAFITVFSAPCFRVAPLHFFRYFIVSAFHLLSGGFTTMSLQGSMAVIRHSGVESTELEGEHSSFLLVPGFWEAVE